MQNLKYKFRLYPDEKQLVALSQVAGNCRFVWNHFLASEHKTYSETKKFNFFNKNSSDLTVLKKEFDWLALAPAVALQQTLKNLDLSMKTYFKNKTKRGFPRFKVKKNFQTSFTLTMVSIQKNIKENTFYIPKVGDVRCVYTRALPSDFASCQIKQESGKWFVVLTVKKQVEELIKTGRQVGIDLNSHSYVLSDGTEIVIPKYLHDSQAKLRFLQKSLSRKKKGSSNRKKAQFKLSRLHWNVKQKRLDFCHKLTTSLIRKYDFIFLEDLNVVGIQKFNGHIIKDNMFALFRSQLEYKGLLYGKTVFCIDRWFPSSKTCNSCGAIKDELKLSERLYVCEHCGAVEDRDLNAAKNILTAGQAGLVCGDHVRRDVKISQLVNEAEKFGSDSGNHRPSGR